MAIRNALGKNRAYIALSHAYYRCLTRISPAWNSKARYKKSFGKKLDLQHPETFGEKLMWLKLNCYNKSPLVKRVCSKAQSLDYVRACGYGNMVLEPIGVWNSVDEIDWDGLPDRFIIKATLGCSGHVFCMDKSAFDREAAKKKLLETTGKRSYLDYAELQYEPGEKVPQQFLAERLLDPGRPGLPDDFKIHCFHGEPRYLMYCFDRGYDGVAQFAMSNLPEWSEAKGLMKKEFPTFPERPACLDEMVACARALSKPFPYVRVDFMTEHGKPYFGELTFTPSGCMSPFHSEKGEALFGKLLDLSKVDVEAFRKLT